MSVLSCTNRIRDAISSLIYGCTEAKTLALCALFSEGHLLISDVPGTGKTELAKALALSLGLSFRRLQFTPDLLPADVIGTRIYNPANQEFSVKQGPVFANIVLADEINRAPAKVQSALLEAMQERQVTIGGETMPLPAPFLVMATQNPIEQEGTYPLPEAQLDRFMFKLKVTYPTRGEESAVVSRMAHPNPDTNAVAVAKLSDILDARALLDRIYIDEKIVEYILDLVIATRPGQKTELSSRQSAAKLDKFDGLVSFGASPRASIALALAARGVALLAGRAYVLPQDVKEVAADVLRHRIVLSYEAEAESIDTDDIVNGLLGELKTP